MRSAATPSSRRPARDLRVAPAAVPVAVDGAVTVEDVADARP